MVLSSLRKDRVYFESPSGEAKGEYWTNFANNPLFLDADTLDVEKGDIAIKKLPETGPSDLL